MLSSKPLKPSAILGKDNKHIAAMNHQAPGGANCAWGCQWPWANFDHQERTNSGWARRNQSPLPTIKAVMTR